MGLIGLIYAAGRPNINSSRIVKNDEGETIILNDADETPQEENYNLCPNCGWQIFEGEESKPKLPNLNEYKLNFGKHNGRTIPEIAAIDRGWLVWAKDNLTREPLLTLIKDYFAQEDEI